MRFLLLLAAAAAGMAADGKLDLPGHPFKLAVSRNGEWVYASLAPQAAGDATGIAVLHRQGGALKLARVVRLQPAVTGIVLSPDGGTLIGSNGEGAVFLDAARLRSGGEPAAGFVKGSDQAGSVYVNLTRDGRTVFVSEERASAIAVVDAVRRTAIGKIPVGAAPIALTFSPGEKLIYTTSQAAAPSWGWPAVCDPESPQSKAGKHPEGAVIVIDVARARTDPEHSIVARSHAGCNPVRLALSPDGKQAYVTARKSNAVLAFDARKLVTDPEHAQVGSAEVGTAPVPVIVVGNRVIAGNSNRFGTAGSGDQALDVIDRKTMQVTGHIPAGRFPRDLVLMPDGRTLLIANFGSGSVQWVGLSK